MPRKGPESKRVYRDLVTLGSGGMAKVYKARQEALDRFVAIKELREDLARDPSLVARFEREAKYAAALQHESIVHVYDFFKEEGTYFIVMEYVDGTDLGAILKKTGAVPPEIAGLVALRLVRALEHAHLHGIIHRDIKPGNILVSKQGELKLSDFGIAKEPDPADMKADLTRTGQAIGTPSYMSPEQIMGDSLTYNSDLFSVGIVIYEMLTGLKPFTSDTATSLLDKIRSQGYTDVRNAKGGVPRALAKIVRRCLKKEPRKRWASTTELRHALEDYVRGAVRGAPEEVIGDWLVVRGIFPPPEKRLSIATTNVAGSMGGGRIRTWAPRAAVGGVALAGIAAAAMYPGVWKTHIGTPPLPTPDGPLARPSFTASVSATATASMAHASATPSLIPSATSTIAATPSVTPTAVMALDTHGAPAPSVHQTPAETPKPKPSATVEATAKPVSTPTATPRPSPSPSPTPKPSPKATATAKATATPTPKSTATATPKSTPKQSATPTPTPKKKSGRNADR